MERMNEERMVKRVMESVVEGRRTRVNPRCGGGKELGIVCVQEVCRWRKEKFQLEIGDNGDYQPIDDSRRVYSAVTTWT